MYQSNEMSMSALNQPSVIFHLSYGVLGGILIRTMPINILLFVIQLYHHKNLIIVNIRLPVYLSFHFQRILRFTAFLMYSLI